jgi:uncharacterized coiled-coil protein SlyX
MDSLQKQVKDLSTKVDALYQVIEQLNQAIAEMLPNTRSLPESNSSRLKVGTSYYQYQRHNGLSDNSMEHKDVLADENNLDMTCKSGEKQLAPEIQIQRLTAQLTAAYNRIAALEEQLLAQRTH